MSDGGNFFGSAGFHLPELLAGLSGGVVRAMLSKMMHPAQIITATVGGALTANYVTTPFQFLAEKGGISLDRGVAGFFVGLTAVEICRLVIDKISSRAKKTNGVNDV